MIKITIPVAGMLALCVSATAVMADDMMSLLPDAPTFTAQGKVNFVGINDILDYNACHHTAIPHS